MRSRAGTLIVGASQAGLQLAVSLRSGGDTSAITLIGPLIRCTSASIELTGARIG